jgi:hypothetical protein
MASEQIETPVDTTTSAAEESAQPEQVAKDSKPRRVRTPPEELFDLTKPLPRVSAKLHCQTTKSNQLLKNLKFLKSHIPFLFHPP